jgi:hypothetical protein
MVKVKDITETWPFILKCQVASLIHTYEMDIQMYLEIHITISNIEMLTNQAKTPTIERC